MLILAGVSLNAIVGENGMITQATNAKIEAENAAIKERVDQILAEAYGKEFDSKEDFITWVNGQFQKEGLEATLQDDDNGYALVYGKNKKIIEYLSEDLGRAGEGGTMVAVTGSIDEWDYVTQEGTNKVKLTAYKGTNKNITIPNIIDGNLVSSLGLAFCDNTDIESVTFSDGLLEIANQAFQNCTNLKSVGSFPNSLTKIGDYAFYNCNKIETELKIGSKVRSVGERAFYNCKKMTGNISDILYTTTSYGPYVLGGCEKIIGDIGDALEALISDEETKIPDYLFSGMSGLTGTITIGSNIVEIGKSAFRECSGVTGIDISEATNLEIIGEFAFYNTSNMSGSLEFVSELKNIGKQSFEGAGLNAGKYLTNLILPFSLEYIGYRCFKSSGVNSVCFDCSNEVTFGSEGIYDHYFGYSKVESFSFGENCTLSYFPDGIFAYCFELTSVTIPSEIKTTEWYTFLGCSNLISVNLGSIETLGCGSFTQCTSLSNIVWSNSLKTIKENAFNGCTSLTKLPQDDSGNPIDSLTTLYQKAFINCSNLGYVSSGTEHTTNIITYLKNSSIANVGYQAFYGCSYLTGAYDDNLKNCKITVTSDVTTRTPGEGTKITLDNSFQFTGVTKGKTFALADATKVGNKEFENVTTFIDSSTNLPITELTLPYTVTSIGEYAFSGCLSLTKITIENTIVHPSQLTNIKEGAFKDCSNLGEWVGNCSCLTTISAYAFYGTNSLTSIGDFSSLNQIGDEAFYRSGFTNLGINTKPTYIGYRAFYGSQLKSFDFSRVTNIKVEAFAWSGLGGSVTLISSLSELRYSAFRGTYITSFDMSNVTNLNAVKDSLGSWCFGWCSLLQTIKIKEGITYISDECFKGCAKLSTIEGLRYCKNIGNNCFEGCGLLTSLDDLSSVESIGNNAFQGCASLTLSGLNLGTVTSDEIDNSVVYSANWSGVSFGMEVFRSCSALVGNVTLTGCTTVPTTFDGASTNLKRTYVTTTY